MLPFNEQVIIHNSISYLCRNRVFAEKPAMEDITDRTSFDLSNVGNKQPKCMIVLKHKPQASNKFSFVCYDDIIIIKVKFNNYDKIGDILAKLAKSVVYNKEFEKMIWNKFEFAASEAKRIQVYVDGFFKMFESKGCADGRQTTISQKELEEVRTAFNAAPNKPQLGHVNQLTPKNYTKLLNFIDNLTCRRYQDRRDILEHIASWLTNDHQAVKE